ncbi:MAG TPA: hypothetical protein VFI73_09295 [Candidatus Nitrosopolaris sp.]|nr:hypothetical protein [Candidatus Nitrosopolaris sp.]
MIEEILILICFSLAGAVSALTFWKHSESKLHLTKHRRNQVLKPINVTRSEIEALQFEKSIVSHSITNIYDAVRNGRIGVIERDRLLLKYKSQLDTFNKKIGELQLAVDITELSEMRTKLVSLLEERIESIDGRLTEISRKCGMTVNSLSHVTKRNYSLTEGRGQEYSEIGEKKRREDKRESPWFRVEDKNIQEVQQEVMQALTRLEGAGEFEDDIRTQIKPDGFTENVVIPSPELNAVRESHPQNKTRDALSFLNEAEVDD